MKKNEEVLNDQIGGTLNPNSDLIMDIVKVENTPFSIVSCEEGHFIALGNYRLSEFEDSVAECEEIIEKRDWNFLFSVFVAVAKESK